MKRIFSCLLVLLLTALLPAGALAAIDVVPYTADFYVADYANVLSDEVEGLVVLNNDQLDKACGAQIVVVTVDNVGNTASLENYAYTLFNEWGIGDKTKNNGLLILISVQEGTYWLMAGKGLQDYITTADLDVLASDYFLPSAQVRNYDEAIRQLFGACFDKISIAYNAGVSVDDSLYYKWYQNGNSGTNGAKFLSAPLRVENPAPTHSENNAPSEEVQSSQPKKEGGFNPLPFAIIAIVLVAVIGIMAKRPFKKNTPPPARRASSTPSHPPVSGKRPTASGTRPPVSGKRPTTSGTRPPVSGKRPTTSGTRPPVSGTRPTTSGTRPPVSGTRPTASGTRPPVSNATARPSAPRPATSRPASSTPRTSGTGKNVNVPRSSGSTASRPTTSRPANSAPRTGSGTTRSNTSGSVR